MNGLQSGFLNRCRFVRKWEMNMIDKINDNIYVTSVKDPERRIFDCLVYMPEGTTYNSYLVKGGKYTALIDCADPDKEEEFFNNLKEANPSKIDYIVLLHSEQDHSGTVYSVLEMYPEAKVVCTDNVKRLLEIHLHMTEDKLLVMKQGESLDLGDMSLTFYPIPFAHWPDNTMVYLNPQNILFSSDLFGAHYTSSVFADDITDDQYKAARGYFSEIMMPFRRNIAKHVEKVKELNPLIIAPAHGAIWNNPQKIIQYYDDWTSDRTIAKVVIPYVSMHNSTRTAIGYFAAKIESLGVEVVLKNLSEKPESLLVQTGELIYELVDASAIVFAFPTILGGPHPAILYTALTANAMSPKTLIMGMLCSYAWASKATDVVNSVTTGFKCNRMEPLMYKGLPTDEDIKRIEEYAVEMANLIHSRG